MPLLFIKFFAFILSSMISINATLGSNFLNNYQADGLLVATPKVWTILSRTNQA